MDMRVVGAFVDRSSTPHALTTLCNMSPNASVLSRSLFIRIMIVGHDLLVLYYAARKEFENQSL
jgi:hypothetical protein